MRPQFALVPLVLLPLAACGGHPGGTTAGAPPAVATTAPAVAGDSPAARSKQPATTTSSQPAGTKPSKTPAKGTNVAKARASGSGSGSGDPRWGTQYAILVSSKLSTRRITYDRIEWYDGKEAVKACAEDGVKPAENDYCTGYYSRNNNKLLRTLTVYPDAPIHVGPEHEARSVDLKTFLAEVRKGSVISFDVDANRIMKLDEVFLP